MPRPLLFLPLFTNVLEEEFSEVGFAPVRQLWGSLNSDWETSCALAQRLGSLCLVRRLPAASFFRPPHLAHGSPHSGNGNPVSLLALPQLTVALQGGVVVLLELSPQSAALFDGGDGRCRSGGLWGTYLSSLFSKTQIPLESGHRYAERPNDFLPRDATVHSSKHLQSQIERVRSHPGSVDWLPPSAPGALVAGLAVSVMAIKDRRARWPFGSPRPVCCPLEVTLRPLHALPEALPRGG